MRDSVVHINFNTLAQYQLPPVQIWRHTMVYQTLNLLVMTKDSSSLTWIYQRQHISFVQCVFYGFMFFLNPLPLWPGIRWHKRDVIMTLANSVLCRSLKMSMYIQGTQGHIISFPFSIVLWYNWPDIYKSLIHKYRENA